MLRVTVAILIGNTDNKLTQQMWATYVRDMSSLVADYTEDIHFCGGPSTFERYQNACWVFTIDDRDRSSLRTKITKLREEYRQDSVAWLIGTTEFI